MGTARFACSFGSRLKTQDFVNMSVASKPVIDAPGTSRLKTLAPGLALAVGVTVLAYVVRGVTGMTLVSPLVLGVFFGMAAHALFKVPAMAKPGLKFASRPILRFAIILLGLQVTFGQVAEVGAAGFAIVAATLFITFFATRWIGAAIGVDRQLSELIAAGTAVCGASAIVATNTVTRGSDEDVAYAMACVTLFGSIAMFGYPFLMPLLHLDPHAYGLWTGASVHEVAQVVAAAFQGGQEAGEVGTIAKLTRVMLLAPLVLGLAWSMRSRDAASGASAPVPWFVFAFIGVIGLNSLGILPPETKAIAAPVTTFLLAVALSAIGLDSDLRKVKEKGLKPLALGAAATLVAAGSAFALISLV